MVRNVSCWIAVGLILLVVTEGRSAIVHRYQFEDGSGTTVADSVGTDHGTIRNAGGTGSWTTGRFGGAWDGTASGFVSVPSTGVPTNRGSFVQWVKVDSGANNWSDPLTTPFVDSDYAPYPMRMEVGNTGALNVWGIPNNSSGYGTIETASPIRDGAWRQLVLTYDQAANRAVVYVDGRSAGSASYDPTGATVNPTWLMGARIETGNDRCSAVYDSAAVYDHALTYWEVWDVYQATSDGVTQGNDLAVAPGPGPQHYYAFAAADRAVAYMEPDLRSGYDALVRGGVWSGDNPPQNTGAWQKASEGDEVILPMAVDLTQGTYEGWFKSETTSRDWSNPLATAIRNINDPQPNDSMRIELTSGDTHIYDAPGAGSIHTGIDTTDGQWHLLSLTYAEGEHVQLFIDGVLAGESSGNYNAAEAIDRGYDVLGMRSAGNGGGWRGSVGAFAYFDRVLSDSEILAHFQTGIPVPEPSAFVLACLGLLAVIARARRRRFG